MKTISKSSGSRQGKSITGRDGYIIRKALAYAIESISRFPEQWQERSDQRDMITILYNIADDADFYLAEAQRHIEQRPHSALVGWQPGAETPSGI